ncbi:MAG: radical SAM/SPASM domain-containing protein [Promethearchaeota archaeon]
MRLIDWLNKLKKNLYSIKKYNSKKNHTSKDLIGQKFFDVELTNKCNTSCIFCPRDKTPKQGLMNFKTFEKVIQRIEESSNSPIIHFCGLGEPLLHPNLVDYVKYLTDKNLFSSVTTNTFFLTKELSEKLLKAGLKELRVSVSGFGEIYTEIHKLNFEIVKKNLIDFMEVSKGICNIVLSITKCEPNKNMIDEIKSYWRNLGIEEIIVFDCVNRGGALDMDYYFLNNEKYYQKAKEILNENGVSTLCMAPFVFCFIGWDGNYYLCCHDFSKLLPLGSVFEYNIEQIEQIKKANLVNGCSICKNCDLDITNTIREIFFKIENNEASDLDLKQKLEELKVNQVEF